MNYVHACVKTILPAVLYSIVVSAMFMTEFLFVRRYDKTWQILWKQIQKKQKGFLGSAGVFCVVCSYRIIENENVFFICAVAIIFGSLLMAAVTDYYTCQVYCLVWWVAGVAECILLLIKYKCGMVVADVPQLVIFCLLQELLFSRMYGRADCHAFCVSALLLWCFGGNMKNFLIHMIISFALLTIVQTFRKNINRKGNLKQPVAFVPYIVFALCLLLGTI